MWKRRFPVLSVGINMDISIVLPIIVATAVLHNICRLLNIPEVQNDNDIQHLVNISMFPCTPLPEGLGPVRPIKANERTRNRLVHYFRNMM